MKATLVSQTDTATYCSLFVRTPALNTLQKEVKVVKDRVPLYTQFASSNMARIIKCIWLKRFQLICTIARHRQAR